MPFGKIIPANRSVIYLITVTAKAFFISQITRETVLLGRSSHPAFSASTNQESYPSSYINALGILLHQAAFPIPAVKMSLVLFHLAGLLHQRLEAGDG